MESCISYRNQQPVSGVSLVSWALGGVHLAQKGTICTRFKKYSYKISQQYRSRLWSQLPNPTHSVPFQRMLWAAGQVIYIWDFFLKVHVKMTVLYCNPLIVNISWKSSRSKFIFKFMTDILCILSIKVYKNTKHIALDCTVTRHLEWRWLTFLHS